MRRLILVRHAAPTQDPAIPSREWSLSPAGQSDAERLTEMLAPYAPVAIITSDERKARQTAQPLTQRLSLTVEVAAGLHEHERRTVGLLSAEVFQATMKRFYAEPDALVFGEETAHQALARFVAAIEEVLAHHPNGDIAIFTHGTVMTLFVAAHSANDPMDFWRHLNLPAWVVFTVPDYTLLEAHMRLPM